jgi:calcium-dependent protein kinase
LAISDVIQGHRAPTNPFFHPCMEPFGSIYKKGKRLGNGSFGEVCEATRISDLETFAIKRTSRNEMLEMGLPIAPTVDNVKWEATILATLDHPRICKLHTCHHDGGDIIFVFELCKGGDLYDYITAHGAYSEIKAKIIARRILEVIAFCHDQGIMHRDIKLENIALSSETDDTDVKLIDFGLARSPENTRKCMSHVGTRGNVAPEMLKYGAAGYHDKICPEKVDLWQFGIVVYSLLSARHPFRSSNPATESRNIISGRAKTSGREWALISDEAIDFVLAALTVDAVERPSAANLLKHPWLMRTLNGMAAGDDSLSVSH